MNINFVDASSSITAANVCVYVWLTGCLWQQTRVLVTHAIHWLPSVDSVVVVNNGQISEIGSYQELLSHDRAFAQFLKTYLTQDDDDDDDAETDHESE